jgi:3-oxoacid CoA-transferase B subunit
VDGEGNIASYEIPGKMVVGPGGAMDLLVGARTVYVVTEHCSGDGKTKLLGRCTYPLTGAAEADVIITERALFRRHLGQGFVLEEVARGHTLDDVAAATDMAYTVSSDVKMEAYG